MNNQEAFKILGLTKSTNPLKTKKVYRQLALKYHPDKNPAGAEMMKLINAAYEVSKNYEGDIDNDINTQSANYCEEINNALLKIINLPEINIEVCGSWVWVTGNTKPHSKILGKKEAGAGFAFASKKKAWYYSPSKSKSKGRGKWSLDKIRNKYGSQSVNQKQEEKRLIN